MKVPTEAELTEDSVLEVILGAQPPRGLIPDPAFILVVLASIFAVGTVLALPLLAALLGEWPEVIPVWPLWTALLASLVLTPLWYLQASPRRVFQTASVALGAWRSKDERLSVVGSMCDVLRQRLQDEFESRERVSYVEARLHVLIRDELRVGRAIAISSSPVSGTVTAAGAAITEEIDRLVAGISGLHAALVSPSPPPNALDWLEAETEVALAGPSAALQRRAAVLGRSV